MSEFCSGTIPFSALIEYKMADCYTCLKIFFTRFYSKYLLVGVLLACQVYVRGNDILPLGTVAGNAGVACSDHYTAWGNPAAAAYSSSVTFSLGYENRYFSPELSDEYISATIPTKYFNVSTSFNFFGFAEYHEMMANIVLSRQLGRFALGVEIDYFNLYHMAYNRYRHAVTAQVGLHYRINANWMLGFRFFNPVFTQITSPEISRQLPVIIQLGSCYTLMSRLDLLLQIGYTFNQGVNWAAGVEYDMLKSLVAKIGVRGSDYIIPSIGAGVKFGKFDCDLIAEADLRIGMSLMFYLAYSL